MTTILIQIAVGVLLGLISAWAKGPTPATHQQRHRPALQARLTRRVRQAGWPLCIALALSLQCGCNLIAPDTAIYIPTGEPVRIAEDIPNVRVEVIGPAGTTIRRMTIPNGWYALPDQEQQ